MADDNVATEAERPLPLLIDAFYPHRMGLVTALAFVFGWWFGMALVDITGVSPEGQPWIVVAVAPLIGVLCVGWLYVTEWVENLERDQFVGGGR